MPVFKQLKNRTFYPLTHPQKRIWYTGQIYPDAPVNNISGVSRIYGGVDFKILEESINLFIMNNDGLRMRVVQKDTQVVQYVDEFKKLNIDFFDFSNFNDSVAEFGRWTEIESRRVTKLEEEVLFYFAMFKISEYENGYFVRFNHIISDGWSMSLLAEQINKTYLKILKGEEVSEECRYSYLDFIHREKKYLSSDKFKKNKKFWLKKFEILPEAPLHKDSNSISGSRKSFDLGEDITEKIKNLTDKYQFSLNTLFLSLVSIYIYKVTQKTDIVIGTPVLNRAGKKERNTFGMFTSTMPFRTNIDEESPLLQFVLRVDKELRIYYFNQKYPYDLLAQNLELRKKGYDSLFQISVNYYHTRLNSELNGALVECMEFYNGSQVNPLQLIIREWSTSGNISFDYDYRLSHYTEEQIESLHLHIMELIRRIVATPHKKIKSLSILSGKEIHHQLFELNSTGCEYPKSKSICLLFEEQVAKTPEKLAISFEDRNLTFRELSCMANQLAGFLVDKGVARQSVVGIMAVHSIEMVVGILGVLKAGCAYLPIDKDYPAERINYMLNDSGASLLLTNCNLNCSLTFPGEIINLEDRELYSGGAANPGVSIKPNDLAYIIYTSGSTGRPKGVMIEHQGLVNYIWWAKKIYVKNDNEVFALYSSIAFDLTITSIFTPLVSGGKIQVYPEDENEYVLYKIMRENKVSIIKLTPSHLSLLRDLNNGNSSVKRFIVGGEDLKVSLAADIHKSFRGNIEIFNEYGPTETVVGCMIFKYNFEINLRASVPIGVPIDNVQIYILDKNLNPVPFGTRGEIFISGDGIARGYVNMPGLTVERFLNNPFIPGSIMYRSGDTGRYLNDGNIEYSGRIDRQVKVRGYRIELGEVEKCLLSHGGVNNGVVIDFTNSNGMKYLCAYYTSKKNVSVHEIRAFFLENLPEYMIPAHFIEMESLPLNSNGKIDWDLLPEPGPGMSDQSEDDVPMDDIERELTEVFKQVLDIEKIGLRDNFYHMGGDSIKAIQAASRLNERGFKMRVKDILSHSTIENLAKVVDVKRGRRDVEQVLCEGIIEHTPIVSWFFSHKFNQVNHWNQSILLVLERAADVDNIETALNAVIKCHDSLRMNYDNRIGFLAYNGSYLENTIKVEVFDLSGYPKEAQDSEIRSIGWKLKSSMNIAEGILFKACIFNLGNQRGHRLLLTAHHLVVDGVSWRIILEDMTTLLNCISEGRDFIYPLKTRSLQEWAVAVKNYSKGPVLKELEYWKSIINHSFYFPVDFNRGDDYLKDCSILSACLTSTETRQLLSVANEAYNTKSDELLVIALALTISHFLSGNQVMIELESHGREELFEDMDVSRTVGWFTSIYPVYLETMGKDLNSQIKSLKEQLRSIPNRGVGFGILKYISGVLEQGGKKSIRFNYLGHFGNSLDSTVFKMAGEDSGPEWGENNQMTCLLDINAVAVENILKISIAYSRNKFTEDTITNFINTYIRQIQRILVHCCGDGCLDFTPSDFDTLNISQSEIDDIFA